MTFGLWIYHKLGGDVGLVAHSPLVSLVDARGFETQSCGRFRTRNSELPSREAFITSHLSSLQ